jgi:hypothetical protein
VDQPPSWSIYFKWFHVRIKLLPLPGPVLNLLVGLANLTKRFTDPLGLEVKFPEENI